MKERDIRPAEIFERYLELSAADAARLFGESKNRVDVPCPGCNSTAASEAFVKEGFRYCQCDRCGSLFASPRPSPDALDSFYSDSASASYWAEVFFPASMTARREKIFAPRVARILALMDQRGHRPSTVIDVGAGYGMFLDEYRLQRPGSSMLAIEPGERLASICRRQGLETLQKPAEQADEWAGRGDLVVCFEVLEHVFSTDAFGSALARLVAPGGYLLLSSLSAEGFDIQVLWEHSKSVSPPHHLNFLGIEGYRQLFARVGLTDIEVLTPGRLDVDIVMNTARECPQALDGQRFIRRLISSEQSTLDRFQEFLAAERLSSHVWVLARRASV